MGDCLVCHVTSRPTPPVGNGRLGAVNAPPRRPPGVPLDTAPDAHAAQTEAYRRLGGKERTAIMFRLNQMAREAAAAGIRSRHPEYSDEQVRHALYRLMLGDELTLAVWPDRKLLEP